MESLEDDSPARGPDGLLPGDLILEVPELIDKVTMNHVALREGTFIISGRFSCFTRAARILDMFVKSSLCSFIHTTPVNPINSTRGLPESPPFIFSVVLY